MVSPAACIPVLLPAVQWRSCEVSCTEHCREVLGDGCFAGDGDFHAGDNKGAGEREPVTRYTLVGFRSSRLPDERVQGLVDQGRQAGRIQASAAVDTDAVYAHDQVAGK